MHRFSIALGGVFLLTAASCVAEPASLLIAEYILSGEVASRSPLPMSSVFVSTTKTTSQARKKFLLIELMPSRHKQWVAMTEANVDKKIRFQHLRATHLSRCEAPDGNTRARGSIYLNRQD